MSSKRPVVLMGTLLAVLGAYVTLPYAQDRYFTGPQAAAAGTTSADQTHRVGEKRMCLPRMLQVLPDACLAEDSGMLLQSHRASSVEDQGNEEEVGCTTAGCHTACRACE